MPRSEPTEPLFAATLGGRDPDAVGRWLTSTLFVFIGIPAVIATPIAFAMLPFFGLWAPYSSPEPFVALSMESGETGEDAWLQQAAVGVNLQAPSPVAPTPVPPPPPAEPEIQTVDPEQVPEPLPPETEGPDTSETTVEDGEEAAPGDEDGSTDGEDTQDATPTRTAGTTPELAPGEMATCLVRPVGETWSVTGCALGLHPDAIGLARGATRGGRVMVTLRGA